MEDAINIYILPKGERASNFSSRTPYLIAMSIAPPILFLHNSNCIAY